MVQQKLISHIHTKDEVSYRWANLSAEKLILLINEAGLAYRRLKAAINVLITAPTV